MKLFSTKTGEEIRVGDTVETFRGEKVVLTSFTARRVYVVKAEGGLYQSEYFPSVIFAEVRDGK